MLAGDGAYVRQLLGSARREVELVIAAIHGAAATFDQTPLRELVEELDDATRHGSDGGRELLLADAGIEREDSEDSDV